MPESGKPQREGEFFDLERDKGKASLYRPDSILRTTEWGGLTFLSLLAAFAFPPYFISVLVLAFFNAGGLFWVTHLSERGRQRFREFERDFSKGHAEEEAGRWGAACAIYEPLISAYSDFPKIAEIASHRVQWIRQQHPEAFRPKGRARAKAAGTAKAARKAATRRT